MLMLSKQCRWSSFVLGALVILGLCGPSFAGTVFTWETDDGTISYTDDAKRIPARYRPSAKSQEMKSLATYPRYTPAGRADEISVVQTQGQTQGQDGNGQVVVIQGGSGATPGFDGNALSLGGSRDGSGVRYQIPIDGASAQAGPTVVEEMRVKPANSMATRTITVVKQDGRIIAVNKAQLNQRSWAGTTATGWDEEDVLK